ncbi:MAG: sugar phosphate isomerase/epimerase [Peptococcaceae bacterium]|jgi:sugar phosphate isomerase/epimerase|nr:sugar phosphate isomerase/epimerase [Peptococcaceae bacterium]
MIKLGCYPDVFQKDRFEAMSRAGYDFTEFPLENLLTMSDDEFIAFKRFLSHCRLEVIALPNPYPPAENILSPTFDYKSYQEKIKTEVFRAAELGCQYIIYAQGNVRMMPVFGKGIQEYRAKIMETLSLAALTAAREGLGTLLELTSKNRTNFGNTLAEFVGIRAELGAPAIDTLCDLRHFMSAGEPFANLIVYKDYIKHLHIDYPYDVFPTRRFPTLADDFDYEPFFDTIAKMGYTGGLAVEARSYEDFPRQITEGLSFFQHFGLTPQSSGAA